MDLQVILVQNLLDAFRQLNQYLGLGLAASVSALALEFGQQAPGENETVTMPGGFVPMSPRNAQLVLLGIGFVAGLMGLNAAESGAEIVDLLEDRELLAAACTHASVATASVGISLSAAVLPVVFIIPIFWRMWERIREGGILPVFVTLAAPYILIASVLFSTPCRAS